MIGLFKLKDGRFRLDVKKNFFFYSEGCEGLEQVAQKSCLIPGGVQGQAGWGPRQSDPAVDL